MSGRVLVASLIASFLCGPIASGQQLSNHPCFRCHAGEVERFSKSAMGESLSSRFDEPGGRFTHKPSGATVTVIRDGEGMRHKVEERGLTADYPIAYSLGYGKVGRSYLIDLNGHLFQSPASFYSAQKEWGASPGYESAKLLDFSRSITADCLTCHAGSVQPASDRVSLTPLSCDRCHGDPANHLKNPATGSIVNPGKLAGRERDSVCEQCHLEGATTVFNPGKSGSDFRPGMRLEAVETHYVFRTPNGDLASTAAVSHAEQLASSACARGSGGKLWCGTCHDPHGASPNRLAEVQRICRTCHSQAQLSASHTPGQDDCVACHMPSRPASDITHAAITDHRILKRPHEGSSAKQTETLASWQPASPEFADRNLGLAYFHLGHQTQSRDYFQKAYNLLAKQSYRTDAEASAALAYLLLGTGRAEQAIGLFEAAANLKPGDAEYWLDLGVAQQNAGQTEPAIHSFERSIGLNPYDYRPYRALSALYASASNPARAAEVTRQYLKLVPQSLTVRIQQ